MLYLLLMNLNQEQHVVGFTTLELRNTFIEQLKQKNKNIAFAVAEHDQSLGHWNTETPTIWEDIQTHQKLYSHPEHIFNN